VLWLQNPPYLRWLAAVCLVLLAAWSEFTPPATESANYLAVDVAAGTALGPELIRERQIPVGTVETVDPGGVAVTDLSAGDPLVASMVTDVAVPAGWMLIDAPVPAGTSPGTPARAVIRGDGSAPLEVDALVVRAEADDPFETTSGVVAVPAEWMAVAATAAAEGRMVMGVAAGGR